MPSSTRSHGPEQHGAVEVPLDAAVVADPLPGDVERHAPVDADHVAADGRPLLEQVRVAGREVDRGHVDRLEHARRVGRDELAVVGDRERAGPGVEELDRVRARSGAGGDVQSECLGELLHQRVPDLRLRVHARLGQLELARGLALDQVARDRERAAREADDGLVLAQRLAHEPHRLERPGHRLLRHGHDQPLDVGERAHRRGDDRPDVLDQLDLDAHPEHREHDVGEHHRRVHVVPPNRLQRHLRAELRLARDLEQPVLLAQLAVLRQRAPGLAHEPDGRALYGLPPGGAYEQRLHCDAR